jgi:hypothetical protein
MAKVPSLPDCNVRVNPLTELEKVTVAPGMTAPDVSVTVPRTDPELPAASSASGAVNRMTAAKITMARRTSVDMNTSGGSGLFCLETLFRQQQGQPAEAGLPEGE